MRNLLLATVLLLAIPAPAVEILIYNGPHWMDDIPTTHPVYGTPEYLARPQRGDIWQLYDDGRCTTAPCETSKFVIIRIPGPSADSVKQYVEAHWDMQDPENPVLLKRRKFHFDWTLLPTAAKIKLRDERWMTVDKDVALAWIKDKATP